VHTTLIAQAIIAEMADEYNALVDRYKQLTSRPEDDREAAMIEQACAAFKTSCTSSPTTPASSSNGNPFTRRPPMAIKLNSPPDYGSIKPLVGSHGRPIRCTPLPEKPAHRRKPVRRCKPLRDRYPLIQEEHHDPEPQTRDPSRQPNQPQSRPQLRRTRRHTTPAAVNLSEVRATDDGPLVALVFRPFGPARPR